MSKIFLLGLLMSFPLMGVFAVGERLSEKELEERFEANKKTILEDYVNAYNEFAKEEFLSRDFLNSGKKAKELKLISLEEAKKEFFAANGDVYSFNKKTEELNAKYEALKKPDGTILDEFGKKGRLREIGLAEANLKTKNEAWKATQQAKKLELARKELESIKESVIVKAKRILPEDQDAAISKIEAASSKAQELVSTEKTVDSKNGDIRTFEIVQDTDKMILNVQAQKTELEKQLKALEDQQIAQEKSFEDAQKELAAALKYLFPKGAPEVLKSQIESILAVKGSEKTGAELAEKLKQAQKVITDLQTIRFGEETEFKIADSSSECVEKLNIRFKMEIPPVAGLVSAEPSYYLKAQAKVFTDNGYKFCQSATKVPVPAQKFCSYEVSCKKVVKEKEGEETTKWVRDSFTCPDSACGDYKKCSKKRIKIEPIVEKGAGKVNEQTSAQGARDV
ncbi:MAG: hypothetical protein KBD63_02925 [Bacteriovoracaceae bacterium]|nr:hypothetical protein [Bacteriovoracaceae bacterium]